MMSEHVHDIQREMRGYIIVGVSLLALTIVTVTVSYLHLNLTGAIIVALFVATVKGSLVACYFMHLISEKKLIYIILIFTVFFFAGMMSLTLFSSHNNIRGTQMLHSTSQTTGRVHH